MEWSLTVQTPYTNQHHFEMSASRDASLIRIMAKYTRHGRESGPIRPGSGQTINPLVLTIMLLLVHQQANITRGQWIHVILLYSLSINILDLSLAFIS